MSRLPKNTPPRLLYIHVPLPRMYYYFTLTAVRTLIILTIFNHITPPVVFE